MRRNPDGSYAITLADVDFATIVAQFDPAVETIDAFLKRISPTLEARLHQVLTAAAEDAKIEPLP